MVPSQPGLLHLWLHMGQQAGWVQSLVAAGSWQHQNSSPVRSPFPSVLVSQFLMPHWLRKSRGHVQSGDRLGEEGEVADAR
jgi:hypothetical protein